MPFDVAARDAAVAAFRRHVYARTKFAPLYHQAEWQTASEGWMLHDVAPEPGQHFLPISVADPADTTYLRESRHQRLLVVPRLLTPRTCIARFCTDLAAFKGGKSFGAGKWPVGFACIPDAHIQFIGAEYSTSEPEFTVLCDTLCSERGMNMKYTQMINDYRNGRMMLRLKTGALFECKSWERKQNLKGKKITAFVWTEAYQLPGLETFTGLVQNIRELRGWSIWTTTPDRPWVGELHKRGHDPSDPIWHCTCGVRDSANPVTYDASARDRNDPDKGGIMTRERFAIAHNGTLGVFVGRVYNFAQGSRQFSFGSHPHLWKPGVVDQLEGYSAH